MYIVKYQDDNEVLQLLHLPVGQNGSSPSGSLDPFSK